MGIQYNKLSHELAFIFMELHFIVNLEVVMDIVMFIWIFWIYLVRGKRPMIKRLCWNCVNLWWEDVILGVLFCNYLFGTSMNFDSFPVSDKWLLHLNPWLQVKWVCIILGMVLFIGTIYCWIGIENIFGFDINDTIPCLYLKILCITFWVFQFILFDILYIILYRWKNRQMSFLP